jgi:hypothetical protein
MAYFYVLSDAYFLDNSKSYKKRFESIYIQVTPYICLIGLPTMLPVQDHLPQ